MTHFQAKYFYLQKNAHRMVTLAIHHGDLIPPKQCEECGKHSSRQLDTHHEDYSYPLEVKWLCRSCHFKYHGYRGEGHRKTRSSPKLKVALDYLNEHPEHLQMESRALGLLIGVSHTTANKAQHIILNHQSQ